MIPSIAIARNNDAATLIETGERSNIYLHCFSQVALKLIQFKSFSLYQVNIKQQSTAYLACWKNSEPLYAPQAMIIRKETKLSVLVSIIVWSQANPTRRTILLAMM